MTKEKLLKKRVILVGYSRSFFSEYCERLNIILGITGSKNTSMVAHDGNHSIEFINIDELDKFHFEKDMCFILCVNDDNWMENVKIFEGLGAVEYESWIFRDYAEAILEDKRICLLAGVCTVQRFGDVLNAIPDFAQKYAISKVQVNFCKNLRGGVARFRHLTPICGLFIYCNLGKEYAVFMPDEFDLPSDCKVYKMPFISVNFLYPQMGKRVLPKRNPYMLLADHIDKSFNRSAPFEWMDENVIECVKKRFTPLETVSFCMDENRYSMEEIVGNRDDCIRVIQLSEGDCDIKAAYIYENYYTDYKLMRDPNHQNVFFFIRMAKQLCRDIDVEIKSEKEEDYEIIYYHSDIPIYPAVFHKLKLSWVNESSRYEVFFNSGVKKLSFEEFILASYDYISTIRHLKEVC